MKIFLQDSAAESDIYSEILQWQRDIQENRVQLTKNVIANSLEQIAQVRYTILKSIKL